MTATSGGPVPLPPADVAELLRIAEDAARAAGELIRSGAVVGDGPPQVARTKTSPTDVVTAMDQAVEASLRRRLADARPGDGVLGEEDGLRAGGSGVTWVLDPIDGTVNYLYGIPHYAVSVAAVAGDPRVPGAWRPLAGCVHHVVSGETWTAAEGRGAWLDGRPLRMPPPPEPARALLATGFGYVAARRRAQARVFAGLVPQVRDVRRIGSAALDLCAVAAGRVDAYYERGLNVWDMAAAALVVTEAGGVVRGLGGRPAGERTVVAAAEPLCGWLADRLTAAGADDDEDVDDAAGGAAAGGGGTADADGGAVTAGGGTAGADGVPPGQGA